MAGVPLRSGGLPPLRTVFLDLGDTLMHIHPGVPELYLRDCLELGLPVDATVVDRALRAGERMYQEALRSGRAFESSMTEARAFWREYNELILADLGVAPGAERRRLADRLTANFWSPGAWMVFPEVHEVLGALRAAGLQLAVISNFTDALIAICATHGLDGYLDCLVASVTAGAQKPDVSIFREALRRTGADPASSVHVGDNYVADVLGARAAGISGILIDRSRSGRPGMFDFTRREGLGGTSGLRLDCPVIGDLRELLELIA